MEKLVDTLTKGYALSVKSIELLREGGNRSYLVRTDERELFLKHIRAPFLDTARQAIDVMVYLLRAGIPVIPIVPTKTGEPCLNVQEPASDSIFLLSEYLPGDEPAPEDTEAVGELIGRLHRAMEGYPGRLVTRDRQFFIGRYLDIMRKLNYSKTDLFADYGQRLWDSVKGLPTGYCHGDLYTGNIHKTGDQRLFVVDFDTSCVSFPIYDAALFCNDTNYFRLEQNGYEKVTRKLRSFLTGYERYRRFSRDELEAVGRLIAIYHYQVQATVLEVSGYDSKITDLIDSQYDWLMSWEKQIDL